MLGCLPVRGSLSLPRDFYEFNMATLREEKEYKSVPNADFVGS